MCIQNHRNMSSNQIIFAFEPHLEIESLKPKNDFGSAVNPSPEHIIYDMIAEEFN